MMNEAGGTHSQGPAKVDQRARTTNTYISQTQANSRIPLQNGGLSPSPASPCSDESNILKPNTLDSRHNNVSHGFFSFMVFFQQTETHFNGLSPEVDSMVQYEKKLSRLAREKFFFLAEPASFGSASVCRTL